MTRFADTFYFLALLNRRDSAHLSAVNHSRGPEGILTTEWVLTELADALASRTKRQEFKIVYEFLRSDPHVEIVPSDPGLFRQGIEFYLARNDKDWSLTDCISFVIMKQHGIGEALTGDHHFEQAGFRALLK